MTTTPESSLHPSLLRTTNALAVVGARQGAHTVRTVALMITLLGLPLATIAALALG